MPATTPIARAASVIALAAALAACGTEEPFGPNANTPPAARIEADVLTGPAPLAVALDASASTDDGGSALAFEWDFGDGSPTATGPFANHVFSEEGAFTVTVQVTDSDGASSSASVTVRVSEREPLYDLRLDLTEGDYWTFAYRSTRTSLTGSGRTSGADAGFITLRLGGLETVGGHDLYRVEQVAGGSNGTASVDPDFALPWSHLGMDEDGSLLGSRSGGETEVLFDASGPWVGKGFFDDFSRSSLTPLRTGYRSGSVDVGGADAFRISSSGSSGGCETIQTPSGPITLCDEISTSGSTAEYFLPGVGPLAFRRNGNVASASGAAGGTLSYELVATSEDLGSMEVTRRWAPTSSPSLQAQTPWAVSHQGRIYMWDRWASGAELQFDVYDPNTDRWTLGPRLGLNGWCTSGVSATSDGSSLILTCARGGQPMVVYRPDAGTTEWGSSPQVAAPGNCWWQGRGMVWSRYLLMMACDSLGFYDAGTNQWTLGSPLGLDDPNGANALVLGDDLYLVGFTDSYYWADLSSGGSWQPVQNTPGATNLRPTFRHPSVAAMDGALYATGGTDGFNHFDEYGVDNILSESYRFDPGSGRWTEIEPMLLRRSGHALVSLNGSLYAIGSIGFDRTLSMERYDR